MQDRHAQAQGRDLVVGWRLPGAYIAWLAALFTFAVLSDRQLFAENEFWKVRVLAVLFYGGVVSFLLGTGLFVLAAVLAGLRSNWGRRALVRWCIGAAAVALVAGVCLRAADRPSAHAYFEQVFGAQMPSSAQAVRVRGETPADPGTVLYSFSCEATETRALVAALGVGEVPQSDLVLMCATPPGWPDYELWKGRRLFERRDGKTGQVDSLLCDAAQTRVYVFRDPLGSKTDAELNGAD